MIKHVKSVSQLVSVPWKKNDDYKGLSVAQVVIKDKQGDRLSVKTNMSHTLSVTVDHHRILDKNK